MEPIAYKPRGWDGFLTDQSKHFVRFYEAEEETLNELIKVRPKLDQLQEFHLNKANRYKKFLQKMIEMTDDYIEQIKRNNWSLNT